MHQRRKGKRTCFFLFGKIQVSACGSISEKYEFIPFFSRITSTVINLRTVGSQQQDKYMLDISKTVSIENQTCQLNCEKHFENQ